MNESTHQYAKMEFQVVDFQDMFFILVPKISILQNHLNTVMSFKDPQKVEFCKNSQQKDCNTLNFFYAFTVVNNRYHFAILFTIVNLKTLLGTP